MLAAARTKFALELRQSKNKQALQEINRRISESELLQDDTFLRNILVQMYGRFGCVEDAKSSFDEIKTPNIFSWNFLINAYAHNGHLPAAMTLFEKMEERNDVTWNSVIAAHARTGDLRRVKELFDQSPTKGTVSWNVMITAYAQNGQLGEATKQFRTMKLEGYRPNSYTFVAALAACSSLIHGKSIEREVMDSGFSSESVTMTALMEMYSRSGSVSDAWRLFEGASHRDGIVWTVMLSTFSKNRCLKEAGALFHKLPVHELVTATIQISALAAHGHLQSAKSIFDRMPERDEMCKTTMTVAYAQNGYLHYAREVFDSMREPHCISWNVMITAYAQTGHGKEALGLLQLMDIQGEQPTLNTLSSIFDACAELGLFPQGRVVHGSFVETGVESDLVLGTSLVNMYGRCGSLDHAWILFSEMKEKNLLTWTAMVAAYAQNGHGKAALHLFHLMELDGVQADDIVFKNVIYACGQAGLSSRSWEYFRSLQGDYGFEAGVEHYKIMIDLLGRSGKLAEAEELIDSMPFQPDQIAWTSFLSSCRVHGDKKRAARAGNFVLQLEPHNRGNYTLLSACKLL